MGIGSITRVGLETRPADMPGARIAASAMIGAAEISTTAGPRRDAPPPTVDRVSPQPQAQGALKTRGEVDRSSECAWAGCGDWGFGVLAT